MRGNPSYARACECRMLVNHEISRFGKQQQSREKGGTLHSLAIVQKVYLPIQTSQSLKKFLLVVIRYLSLLFYNEGSLTNKSSVQQPFLQREPMHFSFMFDAVKSRVKKRVAAQQEQPLLSGSSRENEATTLISLKGFQVHSALCKLNSCTIS